MILTKRGEDGCISVNDNGSNENGKTLICPHRSPVGTSVGFVFLWIAIVLLIVAFVGGIIYCIRRKRKSNQNSIRPRFGAPSSTYFGQQQQQPQQPQQEVPIQQHHHHQQQQQQQQPISTFEEHGNMLANSSSMQQNMLANNSSMQQNVAFEPGYVNSENAQVSSPVISFGINQQEQEQQANYPSMSEPQVPQPSARPSRIPFANI